MNLFNKLIPKKLPVATIPIIGIAGSAGKTSITEIIRQVAHLQNIPLSVINHLGIWHRNEIVRNQSLTQLDKRGLYKFIQEAQEIGNLAVVIEIDTGKSVSGIFDEVAFDTLAFASFAFDHGFVAFDEMLRVYTKLAMQIKENGTIIINQNDPHHADWMQKLQNQLAQNVFGFMVGSEHATTQKFSLYGTSYTLYNSIPIETKLTGINTIINTQIAIQILSRFLDINVIKNSLKEIENSAGRLQKIIENPFFIVIDVARQPHMIESALSYLKNIKSPRSKLISVFGSSVENKTLNQKIGSIVHKYSDIGLITSLDPNTSSVYNINSHLHEHLEKSNSIMVERFNSSEEFAMINKHNFINRIFNLANEGVKPFVAFDLNHYTGRLDAIRLAASIAQPGDVIFIAGKGDEKSTIYNNVEYEWSDHEAVRLAL